MYKNIWAVAIKSIEQSCRAKPLKNEIDGVNSLIGLFMKYAIKMVIQFVIILLKRQI